MLASASAATAPSASDDEQLSVDELVRANLPLVGHLVREIHSRIPAHVNRDDLTSAGMMALVTSAQGFDGARGVPFARFATIRIRGALTDELRSMDWASRGVRSRAREVEKATQELTATLGRTPRREEIASVMGVTTSAVDAVEADVHRASTLSMEGLAEAAGGDLVPSRGEGPEKLLVHREEIGILHDAIAELPERLRVVVEAYFYHNRRMAEIADELGVTESRVSQLRSEALGMLHDGIRPEQHATATPPATATQPRSQEMPPSIPARQRRPGAESSVTPLPRRADRAAKKPSRREAARQAYIATVASRSTLATRLSATTPMGETYGENVEALRIAQ